MEALSWILFRQVGGRFLVRLSPFRGPHFAIHLANQKLAFLARVQVINHDIANQPRGYPTKPKGESDTFHSVAGFSLLRHLHQCIGETYDAFPEESKPFWLSNPPK
ncbi:hypothetical protein QE152_g24314 [Popillia japonica]|uniref:SH2 domain-containing protein n=1 Tax=Popillia japonica TaxID=7064 RepID=A0AAW1KF14_POPJA